MTTKCASCQWAKRRKESTTGEWVAADYTCHLGYKGLSNVAFCIDYQREVGADDGDSDQ